MSRRWAFLLFFAVTPLFGDEVADAVTRGRAARADGVPQAAIRDLKRAASRPASPDAEQAVVELVRCLLESGRPAEAVEWTRRTGQRNQPDVIFWRAQALASNGDYAAALKDYRRAGQIKPGLRGNASFGSARMLEALGRGPDALAVYLKIPRESAWHVPARLASAALLIAMERGSEAKPILDELEPAARANRERLRYLRGRLALRDRRQDDIVKYYDGFTPRDPKLAAGLAIGRAEASVRRGDPEKAEAELEAFVRDSPRNPLIGDLLAKLDEVRSQEKNPSNAALRQWQGDDTNRPLAAAATYALIRNDERQGRTDRAIRNYDRFIRQYPDQPLRVTATIRLARLLLADHQPAVAGDLLRAAAPFPSREDRSRRQFLLGAAEYSSGDFASAAKTFVNAANIDPELSQGALANAALAAIGAGSEPLAEEILNALRKESAAEARRIELAQAFDNARAGNPDVGEKLAWLAGQGGKVGDKARLALAEWRWREGDRPGARSEYRRVANRSAAGAGDQKDYFAVYLEDDGSTRAAPKVAAAAGDFLARHPESPREAEVRMKWGEVLMRTGDYRGARAQFEAAAGRADDADLRASAWFLAARAAAGSMSRDELEAAILMLENVASEKNADLATAARWEQATLQSALGRPEETVRILDSLIAATKDPRLRFAARLKKGDALLLLGARQPERAKDAIAEWREIAASPDVLPAERNEALTHAGSASEQAGDLDGAIAAYYEVLATPRDRQPEYFWYYKAGFAAANLLDDHDRLKEEAAIYEKMAAVPGPRAAEAAERVKRLRLENFIWEN